MSTVWVDGRLVPPGAPAIRADDHALTTGDGVFETAKVVDGVPFALTRHLDRLARSAAVLGLTPDLAAVRSGVAAVLDAAGPDAALARLRVTVTGGPSPLGSARGGDGPTLVVALAPMQPWPATADVVTVPWCRNERAPTAGAKTISYADNVVALAYAHERGAAEAVFANTRGELCEGTGTNVFVVREGRVLTPPLAAGCLAGITRELVLEWVPEAAAEPLPLAALADAEEAFLTSSTRDVQPVARVDGRELPGAPGPLTRRVMAAFAAGVARGSDP